ncbi:ATP-binding protein [Aeromicrobium sp. NPDC092404]|uniref:sensor histidine kinase n=1 Tax=Aeromicrobium sp. NPDC092404 TaxID=3154976 RepID=UPI003438478D
MPLTTTLSRLSVRQRLTVTVALLTSLALLVVGSTLYVLESRRIDRVIEASLTQEIGEFRALQAENDPQTRKPFTSSDRLLTVFLERNLPDANEALYGFRATGGPTYQAEGDNVLLGSAAFRRTVERLEPRGGTGTVTVDGSEYRVAVQPVKQGGATSAFVVTHDVTASREDLRGLMLTYALLAAVSVILIAGLASWIAGRLLSPVRRLRDTARGITDGDLGGRLQVTGHDDLSDLQRTFNDMLDRLESAFVTQRQLLDDAGHELRTPLTILRGHLEVLDASDPEDVAATRTLLLDETDRMSRLVNDLLMLAKARRPDFVTLQPTDAETLTHGVLDRVRALADRTWLLDGVARTAAALDGQRITQALLQLADNAARHTQAGDEIGIGSRLHEGRLELWVRDTGPGVAPELRTEIFERFSRGENDDEGFGLGLSIVRAIAEAHGGDVVLDDTAVGATFRLRLPTGESA